MITFVTTPRANANEDEALVAVISVNEGDSVSEGDSLLELETTKAITPIVATISGYVRRVSVKTGDQVSVGQELIVISDSPDEPLDSTNSKTSESQAPQFTTKARLLARKNGLGIDSFSHISGRIQTEDVQKLLDEGAREAGTSITTSEKLDPVRLGMARTVQAAQQASVPAYLEINVDVSELNRYAAEFQATHGMMTRPVPEIIAFAFVRCLSSNPMLNSVIDGANYIKRESVNLAFAVDAPSGLFMPVIHDSNNMSTIEFVQKTSALRRQMFRDRRDTSLFANPTGGFTSMASFQVIRHIPILLPGTSIMLAHSADSQLSDGTTTTVIGTTYDHQLLSGADVGRMLKQLRGYIENPASLE